MKLYSDKLRRQDLYFYLPDGVDADIQEIPNTRIRARGWIVHLEGMSERHRRATNSGNYGGGGHKAATWDDWGVWMYELFKIDPDARIGNYDGLQDFLKQTREYQPAGMLAPWLAEYVKVGA